MCVKICLWSTVALMYLARRNTIGNANPPKELCYTFSSQLQYRFQFLTNYIHMHMLNDLMSTTNLTTVHNGPCLWKTNNLMHLMEPLVNTKPFFFMLQATSLFFFLICRIWYSKCVAKHLRNWGNVVFNFYAIVFVNNTLSKLNFCIWNREMQVKTCGYGL